MNGLGSLQNISISRCSEHTLKFVFFSLSCTLQVARSTGNPLDEKYQRQLEHAVATRLPAVVSDVAFQIPALRMAIKLDFLKEIDNACTKLCKKKASSVLRAHRFEHMADFSWSNIIEEMSACCGDLLDVLATVTKGSRAAVIGMTYGMLMQARNHEMSICQRVNTVLLMDGGAKKQVSVFITDFL